MWWNYTNLEKTMSHYDRIRDQMRNSPIVEDNFDKYPPSLTQADTSTDEFKQSIDPKQSCADKKLTFDSVPITLKILASPANQSGADKYGVYNWLQLEDNSMSMSTYLNALERHLTLFRAGQDYTSDTNVHNLDSMIAGLAVLRDAMIFNKVKDDRTKLSPEQIIILENLINKT